MVNKKYNNPENELKRDLGFLESVTLVIGMVIGSGIFFKPGVVFKNAGAPGLGILAWVAGGIITLAAGLTIAEIASAIPKTGGLFTYLDELFGGFWAFLLGWVQTFIYYPGSMAALSIVFVTQSTFFINVSPLYQKLIAILVMEFLVLMNIFATKYGGYIQSIATFAKLLPIIAIIAIGLVRGTQGGYMPFIPAGGVYASGFGAAILGTLWAYDGWIGVGNVAGEIKNPVRNLPRAIILGLSMVILVYVLMNVALLNVLPMNSLESSLKPASDAAVSLLGKSGAAIIAGGIMVSIFGALNGYTLTGARVPLAMGERGLMPFSRVFSRVHPRFKTPSDSLILEGALGIVYIATGSFNTLTDLIVFVLWIFFILALAGIFVLRRRYTPEQRPYKVPLYPVIPLIGIVGGIYIVISTVLTQPWNALYGIIITLIGVPVYYLLLKSKPR